MPNVPTRVIAFARDLISLGFARWTEENQSVIDIDRLGAETRSFERTARESAEANVDLFGTEFGRIHPCSGVLRKRVLR